MVPCPHTRGARPVYVVAALALCVAESGAQQASLSLGVGGGTATDARGVRSSAASVTPSLAFAPDPRVSIGLSGSATRFAESAWALGGTGALAVRLPIGSRLALAASGTGALTRTSFDATYTSLTLLPTLEARVGPATLFAGAQHVRGGSVITEVAQGPGGLLGGAGSRTVERRDGRASTGALFGALATFAGTRAGDGASLHYREEHARVGDVRAIDRTLGGGVSRGRVHLGASGGRRWSPAAGATFGSVAATVGVGRMLALQGAVGSYPASLVTGVPGGRFVSVGVLLHGATGGDAPRAHAPRLRGAPPVPEGHVRLVLRAPDARQVEVAGDWTGWRPVPARRAADGAWYADARVPRGEHRYAFRVDGARWTVPDGAPSVDDGFGGRSAVLVVP